MAKATIADLLDRTQQAIDNNENFIYDVAADSGQIVDNVKHMKWFRNEVAQHLIDNFKKWGHLSVEVNQ